MFEYDDFLITYHPSINVYEISSLTYVTRLGHLSVQEGPGWILTVYVGFLDASMAKTLAELMETLNETIEEIS